jgi:HK97 family phage portal protein
MRLFGLQIGGKAESRATVTQSASPSDFYEAMGITWLNQVSDVPVTIETALGVPAIWSAVNLTAGTIAGLPMHLYRRSSDGSRAKVDSTLSKILHDAPNEEQSSFEFRKWFFEQVFTGGRGLAFIERNAAKEVTNIWPLEPSKVTIRRENGRKLYDYRGGNGRKTVTYEASEILDIPFMLKADGLGHRGPIMTNRGVVALAIAANEYASKYFLNGGVPPFAVTGNFQSGKSMGVAADDLQNAVRKAAKDRRQALVLPSGLDIKAIGADAEKTQLIETKRFLIEEFARIYALRQAHAKAVGRSFRAGAEPQAFRAAEQEILRRNEHGRTAARRLQDADGRLRQRDPARCSEAERSAADGKPPE